jgi:hypothetical protein
MTDAEHMTISRRLSITLACTAALSVAAPGIAFAAPHHKHAVKAKKHTVKRAAAVVLQPTVVVPHIYDAGGDGGELTTPAGVNVKFFNAVGVAAALGNGVLAELGLPPLPAVPAL